MSRLFNDAALDRLEVATPVVTAHPLSMGCWFNSDDAAVTQNLMGILDTAGNNNWWRLLAAGATAGDPVQAASKDSATVQSAGSTSTGYTAGVWHHALAVFASATSRAAYIDGGSKGTNAVSRSPAGLDVTVIGRQGSLTPTQYVSGLIAEAAIWDTELSDADALILARGYSPLLVRPENLVAYWPLIGRTSPEIDVVGRFELTVTGAVVAAHPRILRPFAHAA